MSEFKNKAITTKGLELLSKALAGGKLTFTRIEMGSGVFTDNVVDADALVSVKQNLQITSINRKGSNITLSSSLKLEDIKEEYDWTEVGVYAKGIDNKEVLYLYGYTENSSFISPGSLNEKLINITVMVSNVAEVTAIINDSLVYLAKEDLDAHNVSASAHEDIRELIKELQIEVENIDVSEDIEAHNVSPVAHADIRAMIEGIDLQGVKNHVTSEHTSTKAHVTNQHDTTRNTIASQHTTTKSHVTTKATDVKNHVTGERAVITQAITDAMNSVIATINNKPSDGDVCGKDIRFEKNSVVGVYKGTNVFKSYSNSKGGFVRISTNIGSAKFLTLVVDGVQIFKDMPVDYIFGRVGSSGNSTGADGTPLDVPFKESFILSGGYRESTSSDTTSITYTFGLTYYLNK